MSGGKVTGKSLEFSPALGFGLLMPRAQSPKRARSLRQLSTEPEKRLWHRLRDRQLAGYKFRRQHPLAGFVLDFACVECRLAVEVDGGQHADSAQDLKRDHILRDQGWRVLRFWNTDVMTNMEGVLETLLRDLQARKHIT